MTDGVERVSRADGITEIRLSGHWRLDNAVGREAALIALLGASSAPAANVIWNGMAIESLDSAGALALWRAWGRSLPVAVQLRPEHRHVFDRLAAADRLPPAEPAVRESWSGIRAVGTMALNAADHLVGFITLLGQLLLDMLHVLRYPVDMPRREISATLFKAGAAAMPVAALVGFLIGVVLSYLSALQLRQFGADGLIVNILGLGIVRELGPVLVAVLVAGRSGSAMTAQLGVMRVTEEIDALATMGVSRSLRLVLPKVIALAVAMPLLVLWTSAIALLGGMISAQVQLDIDYGFFMQTLPRVVPVANLWIGLSKGVLFGIGIALVACHFGLRVKPNTESLSVNTTTSVVTAITLVIIIDALFAIATRRIGLPTL